MLGFPKVLKTEVSLHNKRTDCWIIIKDKVYDVTSYVEEHPGGDAILVHAGDDSIEGFFGYASSTKTRLNLFILHSNKGDEMSFFPKEE
ncbi:Cytochrome B5-like protein [Dionaea muscipula]